MAELLKIEQMDISAIKPYKNNPRNNDNAVDAVAESIKRYGWKQPIVIDKNHEIIVGHTRYKAAKKLGMEVVPCVIADDLTEKEVREYRLVDNKVNELAEWNLEKLDIELDALDFDGYDWGFSITDFDWEDIGGLSDDNGSEADSQKLRCPFCGNVDSAKNFKKV